MDANTGRLICMTGDSLHAASIGTEGSSKRIALVFKRLDVRGGAEVMGRLLIRLFTELDHELTIIARKGSAPPEAEFIRVNPFHLGRNFRYTGFARAVRRVCKRLGPDVIYSREHVPGCHIYHAGGGAHAEMFHQTRRIEGRIKRTLDYWHPHHRGRLRLERRMYASPELQGVICNSEMVRDDIERRFDVSRSKLHVVENGIDTAYYERDADANARRVDLRADSGIGSDALVLLFVGSGFHRKGLGVAIQALAQAESDAHLVVVGRDRSQRLFGRLAARLGVADQVHFVGGQSDVRSWYWMGDALIHPALYEAYGLIVPEAMAAGLPVIASKRCGSALSLVVEGQNGYLADALDTAGFAFAIDKLAVADHRCTLGEAAAKRAKMHDIEVMRARFRTVMNELVEQVATRSDAPPNT